MNEGVAGLLVAAGALVVLGGLFAMAEAALTSFSRVRAEELVRAERRGAPRLLKLMEDAAPHLNTLLLMRLATEITATVLVAVACLDLLGVRWQAFLVAAAAMLLVSFVAIGVAPRTLGRQNSEGVALVAAGPTMALTKIFGPLTRLFILIGNALTPGKGFREGPFVSEAELREFVDYAEESRLIESEEREMIHSVFELGDTIVREVMVPRTDIVYIEGNKTLRQCLSLALRSGFSRIPVMGQNIDDVVGIAYLKDVTRRVYDNRDAESTERVESVMRPAAFVPDSKPVDDVLRDMQSKRVHLAIVVDEYGGTAGLVTIEDILEEIVGEITDEYDAEPIPIEHLVGGAVRVSSRLHIDELGDVFGLELSDEDVDSVGGLMAKHLGRVPIPGATVDVSGLRLVAESVAGRRNQIGTVVVTRLGDLDGEPVEEDRP